MSPRKRPLHDFIGAGPVSANGPIPKRGVQPKTGGPRLRLKSPEYAPWCPAVPAMDADGLRRHLRDAPLHRRIFHD